jgi:hypothetical protein
MTTADDSSADGDHCDLASMLSPRVELIQADTLIPDSGIYPLALAGVAGARQASLVGRRTGHRQNYYRDDACCGDIVR